MRDYGPNGCKLGTFADCYDGSPWELHRGELVEQIGARDIHGILMALIAALFRTHAWAWAQSARAPGTDCACARMLRHVRHGIARSAVHLRTAHILLNVFVRTARERDRCRAKDHCRSLPAREDKAYDVAHEVGPNQEWDSVMGWIQYGYEYTPKV